MRSEEPAGLRGQRGPEKTGNLSGFEQDEVIEAELVEDGPDGLTPTEVRDLLSIASVATVDELIEKLRDYLDGGA